MKLKGQTVRTGKKEYVLKDLLGEGGFSMIYETNVPDIICKVQVLANLEIAKVYNREKYHILNSERCCNSYHTPISSNSTTLAS